MATKKQKWSFADFYRKVSRIFSVSDSLSPVDEFGRLAKRAAKKVQGVRSEGGGIGDSADCVLDANYWNVGSGAGMMPRAMASFYMEGFIGWQACSMLSQHWLIAKACSVPAEDALAPGFFIHGEHEEVWRERLAALEIEDVMAKAVRASRTYGQALIVPVFASTVDMEAPFNPDGLKAKIKSFQVVNPMFYSPEFGENTMSNAASPEFYKPTFYVFAGNTQRRVHSSWVFKVMEPSAPDMLFPMYYYGGVPITQKIYRAVYAACRVADEIPLLVETKRLLVADSFSSDVVMNPEGAQEAAQGIAMMRDNFGVLLKDPDSKIAQIDTSLSDLDRVLMAQMRIVAAVAEIPVNKLLRYQESGTASSNKEDSDYRQVLGRIAKFQVLPALRHFIPMITVSDKSLGKPEIGLNEYDFASDKEKMDCIEKFSVALMHAATTGAISRSEYKKALYRKIGSIMEEDETPVSGELEPEREAILKKELANNLNPEDMGGDVDKPKGLSNAAK